MRFKTRTFSHRLHLLHWSLVIGHWLLFLLFSSALSAQKVEWSSAVKVNDRALLTEVIGQSEGLIVLTKSGWKRRDRDIYLEVYSEDMHRQASRAFMDGRDEHLINIVLYPGQIQLFFTTYDKNQKQLAVKVKRLNLQLAQTARDTTLFYLAGDDPSPYRLNVEKQRNATETFMTFTRDANEIPTSLTWMILDSGLSPVDTNTMSMRYENKYALEQVSYAGGDIALLIREQVKKKEVSFGFRYSILYGSARQTNLSRTDLFGDSLAVTEGILKADYKNNAIIFCGLFANKDSGYLKGYRVWRHYGGTSSRPFEAVVHFPEEVLIDMSGMASKVKGIANLRTGDLAFRNDGGLILTCEEYHESRESIMDMNMYGMTQSNLRYYYYYQNLLVMSINTAGKIDWHSVLRKDQVTVNDNGIFSSYLVSVMPDKVVLVYNDLSRKNWVLSTFEVTDKGQSSNQIIIRAQEYDGRLVPQLGAQISYNSLIIPGTNRRGQVLLKLTY